MKIADVTNQLAKIIPQVTDFFSDTLGIVSISGNGTIITVETSSIHGLSTGGFVNVRDVESNNPIASVVFSIVDGQSFLEVETTLSHDLTLNPRETETIFAKLAGFTDSAWNASLELVEVSNRKTFKVINGTASAPILNSSELLLEIVLGQFNGPQIATVIDTTNFSYPSSLTISGQGGDVQTNIRIAGIVNFERALDQYTKKLEDKFFMFVVAPTSTIANKSRGSQTDINDEQTQQSNFNENIRDGFIILVIGNVAGEAGALKTMDNIRDEVFRAILLAVRGVKFPSGLACEPNQVTSFLSHGTLAYDNARYIHQFIFEMPLVMTIDDSVQAETRAFRDIDFTNSTPSNADAPDLIASIDLDDDSLP